MEFLKTMYLLLSRYKNFFLQGVQNTLLIAEII